MAVASGTRLGPYEVIAQIGAGGMGEVYRARDTRLDRLVAIKVLPPGGVDNPMRRDRLDREARIISSLNHPYICTLYDIGHHDGGAYLVMELIDGQSLADRLARGALPLQQALEYAVQIAEALDAAHRRGIVHRDLKPANVMLTKSGVKVLDFGIAKTTSSIATVSATTLTAEGTLVGTLQYMAPELLEGQDADARTDVFAFGAVLYEMLTGKRAFEGESQASLIAAILRGVPPPLTTALPTASPALDRIVRTCLAMNADDRWQNAGDLRRELKWVAEGGGVSSVATAGGRGRRRWIERAVWLAVAVGASVALGIVRRAPSTTMSGDPMRLSILLPDKVAFTGTVAGTVGSPQLAISPDGRAIVYVAAMPGARPTLWLRRLDDSASHVLTDTEGADLPFWSPDNRWIGYFADGTLKKVPVAGGPSLQIAVVSDPRAASWGPDGTILFSRGNSGILRVSASGGAIVPVTELAKGEGQHRQPQFLPDGHHFIFVKRTDPPELGGVYAGSLDGKTNKQLIRSNTSALYATSGHLLFLDGDTLMAQAFNAGTLDLTSDAFAVQSGIGRSSTGTGSYSISDNGTLIYASTLLVPGRLTWFDRTGTPSGSVGSPGDHTDFRLSPDGRRLAASLVNPRTSFPDIWITDLDRNSSTPFTFGPAVNGSPVWSVDGARILFRCTIAGLTDFCSKSAGGGGKEEILLALSSTLLRSDALSSNVILSDWSPDGKALLFSAVTTDSDLWLVAPSANAKAVRFLSAPGDQGHGNFSPDGRLVAYSSNESGRFEVYVQTFPLSDHQWTISTAGGYEPRWRADGRELYYLSADQKLMVVDVTGGPAFGAPRVLFQTHLPSEVTFFRTHYIADRDGRRFLINTPTGDQPTSSISVVLNWFEVLKQRVPMK